jgi:HAD superfamily hydrolase (TIGR01549 family)
MNHKNKKIIFVDIFDTIIFRKIHPFKVIELWADFIITFFGLNLKKSDLIKLRSESFTSIKMIQEEASYDDVLRNVYSVLCTSGAFPAEISYTSFYQVCHEEEIILEMKSHFKNGKIIDWLKKIKKQKNIYCISDFYLSKDDIIIFFSNLGIKDIFDDIFISSDYCLTKRTGNLYQKVVRDLGCSPSDCIMIGDNKISDKKNAQKNGICANFIPNYYQHLKNRFNKIDCRGGVVIESIHWKKK